MSRDCILYFDGSYKDENIGYGGVIYIDSREIEYSGIIENRHITNSTVAEWIALINGMMNILVLLPEVKFVKVYGDAKSVILAMQKNKLPKCKALQPYFHLAGFIKSTIGAMEFEWVSEKQNRKADRASKSFR
jgi:ribonuclease HI